MPQPGKLSLHFVIPDGKTKDMVSKDMQDAFQACEELRLQPRWETETQCLGRKTSRQDVFVFEEFEGKLFKSLKIPLCVRVVGARCLLTCVRRNISIPDIQQPVYTAAMHNVTVTTTQLESEVKEEVRQLVTNMGGMYCNSLRGCVTHVVAGNVISVKCQESKKKNLKLMTVEWVRGVWEASLARDVVAVDEEFDKYVCPLFHGVVATCTKLRTSEKKELLALIQNNGGVFTGFLDASTTNLLIVGDPTGDKFQCAQQNDISCLSIQWVRDCVANQEIVPFEDYVVVKGKQCSTPVHDQSKFLPDFSAVSSIEGRPLVSHVDETLNSTVSSMGEPVAAELTMRNILSAPQVEEAVQQLVASHNQKAGPFLDGCKIFLSGFTTVQVDRLRRVLNRAGATRYDEISEALTHVVIGRVNAADMKLVKSFLHKPHVVTVQWLALCVRLECPAPEEQFLCCGNESAPVEPPSPLSKKGVAALQHNMARSVPAFPSLEPVQAAASTSPQEAECEPEAEPLPAEDLVHQYLHSQPGDETVQNAPVGKAEQNDLPEGEVTKIIVEQDSSSQAEEFTESTYFDGLVFEILGYEDEPESEELIMETVLAAGGRMAQGGVTADYAITPCVVDNSFPCRSKHAVNYLWLEECSDQQQVLTEPLDYYYRTVKMNLDSRPLQDCVLTPSSYAGRERTFLVHLMQALGARVQHVFSRIAVPEKDLLPATHLVTQDTSSPKYRAALKWRLLAVSHVWLLACVAEDHHVDETPFLVNPDASKGSSGEEASVVDKTAVKHTPKKASQADVAATSKTNEGASKVLATAGAVSTRLNHSDVPSADRSKQQSSESEKVGTRAGDEVVGEGGRPSIPAGVSTPAGPTSNLAARRSCASKQSPAPSTPMGPPEFTTPVDGHRRLGMLFSQETPLRYEGAEPSSPSTPGDPHYISTPETPYGQFLVTDPSPNTKKSWKRWLESVPNIPKSESPAKKRRESTPVSELKRRIRDGLLPHRQVDRGDCTDPPTTEESQGDGALITEQSVIRRAASVCTGQLLQSEASEGRGRESAPPEHESAHTPEPEVVGNLSWSMTQSSANNPEQTPHMKTGPGVHTQIVRLNEALSARKQQDSGGVKKKRCADDWSNSSVDDSVTLEHNREYKALMGLEVPTEIAVTWEYRQNSEQSEVQTQSQDLVANVQRVFSLSCVEAQRAHFEGLIKSLGGQVSQSNMYDPTCTHLVCERLARSERMLGTIAAGKWVLHPSYITDSDKAGHFLPEEGYEWGSPTCRVGQELVPGSLPHTLACAAHRWRGKVARDGCAAFSSLKVLVLVGKERQDQFKRCVLAGNGKVVLLSEWSSANVCIVDVNKVSLDKPISLASFVRNNIPCVPTLFLYEFLMREPQPSATEFAIPEYKELCRQREQSSSSSSS